MVVVLIKYKKNDILRVMGAWGAWGKGGMGSLGERKDGVMGGQEWRHEGEESKINLTVKILFDLVDFIIKLVNQGWKQFGFYRRVCWGE